MNSLRAKVPPAISYQEAHRIVKESSNQRELEMLLDIVICERWIPTSNYESIRRIYENTDTPLSINFYEHVLTFLLNEYHTNNSIEVGILIDTLWIRFVSDKHLLKRGFGGKMIEYHRSKGNIDAIILIASLDPNPSEQFLNSILISLRDLKAYDRHFEFWKIVLQKSKRTSRVISPFLYKNILFAHIAIHDYANADDLIAHFQHNRARIIQNSESSAFPEFWSLQVESFYKTCLSYYSQVDQLDKLDKMFQQCEHLIKHSLSFYHIMALRYFNADAYSNVELLWQTVIAKGIKPDGDFIKILLLSLIKSEKIESISSAMQLVSDMDVVVDEKIYLGVIRGYVTDRESMEVVINILHKSNVQLTNAMFSLFIYQISNVDSDSDIIELWQDIRAEKYGSVVLDIQFYNTLLKDCCLSDSKRIYLVYDALLESGLEWNKETYLWTSKMRLVLIMTYLYQFHGTRHQRMHITMEITPNLQTRPSIHIKVDLIINNNLYQFY